MEKEVEYEFFYLNGERNPYAYSGDKSIRKAFKDSRNMDKFISKKYYLTSSDLYNLSKDDAGSLLLNYNFLIGNMTIRIPITLNEKLNIEGYGNKITMLDIYLKASVDISVFNKEVQQALRVVEYDRACYFGSKNPVYHTFTPDLFIIFMKYYGELINLLPYKERGE